MNISIDVYEISTGKLIQQVDGYKEDEEKGITFSGHQFQRELNTGMKSKGGEVV